MDYKKLHLTSSIDILPDFYGKPSKRRRKADPNVFEVERLVGKRCISGITQYLVKWRGWSRYDASWVDEDNISEDCIEYFNNPTPPTDVILEATTEMRQAVECFLKGKCHLAVSIPFPSDVFKFLFHEKGVKQSGWYLLGRIVFLCVFFQWVGIRFWTYLVRVSSLDILSVHVDTYPGLLRNTKHRKIVGPSSLLSAVTLRKWDLVMRRGKNSKLEEPRKQSC